MLGVALLDENPNGSRRERGGHHPVSSEVWCIPVSQPGGLHQLPQFVFEARVDGIFATVRRRAMGHWQWQSSWLADRVVLAAGHCRGRVWKPILFATLSTTPCQSRKPEKVLFRGTQASSGN